MPRMRTISNCMKKTINRSQQKMTGMLQMSDKVSKAAMIKVF